MNRSIKKNLVVSVLVLFALVLTYKVFKKEEKFKSLDVVINLKPSIVEPRDMEKVNIASGKAYDQFEELFKVYWRKYQLDTGNEPEALKSFVSPIPAYNLEAVCNGMQLYWFDFTDFKGTNKDGNIVELGGAYSGSAGVYGILFGVKSKTKTLKILFDNNVISFGGLKKSEKNKNCPDIIMKFSGNHFKLNTYNGNYGYALVRYSPKAKKYIASKEKYREITK